MDTEKAGDWSYKVFVPGMTPDDGHPCASFCRAVVKICELIKSGNQALDKVKIVSFYNQKERETMNWPQIHQKVASSRFYRVHLDNMKKLDLVREVFRK